MLTKPRRFLRLLTALTLTGGVVVAQQQASGAPVAGTPVINEFVANTTGTDTNEFVEIYGLPGTDLSTLTIVEIEGDSGSTGLIDDGTFTVGTTDASGFWATGFQNNVWENGTMTLLLVEGYTGTTAQDLDTDDDGVYDVTPWTSIVDSVAVHDGGAGDLTYSTPELLAGFDGGAFTVGGASRIPDGTDTDATTDWVRNDYDGAGLPDLDPGDPQAGEALNTPGAANQLYVPEVPDAGALLLTEIVVTPTDGELVEIHNPSADAVDLSNVYLTDATFAGGSTYYYNIVTGTNAGGGGFGDFFARFPDGASIGAGEYQTVAMSGSDGYFATYGAQPTYELWEDAVAPDAVPDMREALAGSIGGQGGLTNSGEVVVLFEWDGTTDLVGDIDYAIWGDTDEAVDKTGVAIDGPDVDLTTSTYLDDTAIASQELVAAITHLATGSWQRSDLAEGNETQTGGNGVDGHDEMSENLSVTWCEGPSPTPLAADNCPGVTPGDLVISEIMQNPAAVDDGDGEWFEITNVSGVDIDIEGWTISDLGSDSHDIANGSPLLVPAGGYLVLGINGDTGTNGGITVDYAYSGFTLGNTADEVVLTAPGPVVFDSVAYDGGTAFPDPTGASMNLNSAALDTLANDSGSNWCESLTDLPSGDRGTPGAANTDCAVPISLIHDIQGSAAAVAITGPAAAQAIVTSLITRDDVLDGFFVQEEDADVDADTNTSEGIYVHCRGNCPGTIAVGDLVTVTGVAEEYFGMSQIDISAGSTVIDSSGNALPATTAVTLPASGSTSAEATFETVEAMLVEFTGTLAVSEYYNLARYGQITLTDTERPQQYTQTNAPDVVGYAAALDDLATRRIILDDDNNDQNDTTSDGPDEEYPYLTGLNTTNRFRGGDTITGMTGVLHWSFAGQTGTDAWRVRPSQGTDNTFAATNPAPAAPDAVGGTLTVAAFNVLNYFATIDEATNLCGPNDEGCRGADSAVERDQQRDKIVSALAAIDGDIVGLIELENDDDDASIAQLVDALNTTVGAGTYDYIATGFVGTDVIKVGLIYQPGVVTPVGSFQILDSSVDPTFNDDKNRAVLVQTFDQITTGERLTVAVNHLKSKGSDCDDLGDPGLDDGQGNCPTTRLTAATALANYLDTDPTGSGDPDFLILGDLNSYAMEPPIEALETAGYTDTLATFSTPDDYSYLFDGQLGTLDYAMSSTTLTGQVTGATSWHINADENPLFDYNDAIQDGNEQSYERESTVPVLFAPDPLRSSDHDPIIVGLELTPNPTVTVAAAAAQADPTNTAPIEFTATFDQDVTGFDAGDVQLGGTAGASGVAVTAVDAATYTISVSGMANNGTVEVSVLADAAVNGSAQGNGASLIAAVEYDITPPVLIVPATIETTNDPGEAGAVVDFVVTATDDGAAPAAAARLVEVVPGPTIVCTPASGSFFPIGETEVSCTATDAAGNTTTDTFLVRVTDDEAPVITGGTDTTVEVTGGSGPVDYPVPTVDDNADGATIDCVPASGSVFSVGTTTVTCTATDASGNESQTSFDVMVEQAAVATTTTTVAPTSTVAGELPSTGGDSNNTLRYALLTLVFGFGLLVITRRRRTA